MSVVKAQATIYPCGKFPERILLTTFTARAIVN